MERSIQELLESNCIRECRDIPHNVNPLSVAEGNKLRLVLDLRDVNPYVEVKSVKYEDLRILSQLLEKDDFFASFDLKSGYHHIAIAEEFQTYLGFAWTDKNGKTTFYIFCVLPFGLSSACHIFTKFMRPLVKKWRAVGTRCVVYLDDGIFSSSSRLLTSELCHSIRNDLKSAGLQINEKKSNMHPTQTGEWLGFIIDTRRMEYRVPERKIEALSLLLQTTHGVQSAKKIAKIAGRIISTSLDGTPNTV